MIIRPYIGCGGAPRSQAKIRETIVDSARDKSTDASLDDTLKPVVPFTFVHLGGIMSVDLHEMWQGGSGIDWDGKMHSRRWLMGLRLFLGFLVAPAIVGMWLSISMDAVLAHLGWHPSDIANIMLALCWFEVGVLEVYFVALFVGLPAVLAMLNKGCLRFRWIMLPAVVLAPVYAANVYASLCWGRPTNPFVGIVAALQVPGVIVSGLCFYFISAWKLQKRDTGPELTPTGHAQE
jgi:hypothetical protein